MEAPSILPILKKIPLFAELNEEDHSEIIKKIKLEFFPADQLLLEEGGPGDKLYIIKKGAVKIFHPADEENAVAMLGPNEFFGEMALVEDKPRSASAITRDECEIFLLERADFYDLILKNQAMASRISEEFLDRIQENQRKASEPLT
jgi:CRP-like cAMP-binding protein